MRLWVVLLTIALAGCFTSDSPPAPTLAQIEADVEATALDFLVQTHGGDASEHFDARIHNGSANVAFVGYHNGVDNTRDPNSIADGVYYTELAVHEGYVYLARASQGASIGPGGVTEQQGGFVIIDARDPQAPRYAGEFDALSGFDIDVSYDGALAFFSTQRNSIEEMLGNTGEPEDAEDLTGSSPRGVYIVDVRDKTTPVLAAFEPFPYNGPHTTTYYRHGERELLFVQTYDLLSSASPLAGAPIPGPLETNPVTQRVSIFEIQRNEGDDRLDVALVPIAHYQIAQRGSDGALYFPHDVVVQEHPMRGELLAYVAYWDMGVRIVDLESLPSAAPDATTNPLLSEVGSFREFSPSSENAIHLAKPFQRPIDGRHITVAEPEIVQNADETGQITFIDTSNPGRPEKACETSYWTLPGELSVNNFDFSPHNFDTWEGHVALAHNHAGIWIIDVHDGEALCDPASTGFYMDTFQRADAPHMQPRFWGVFEEQGLLYASDMSTGLYILEYTGV